MTRFRVVDVFEIPTRGIFASGEVLQGDIRVGLRLRVAHRAGARLLRIGAVEFSDSPSAGEHRLAILLEGAGSVQELRQELPPGTVLCNEPDVPPA